MRMLLFVSDYPPYGNTSAIHYFAREWVKTGNEVYVVYGCQRLIFPLYLFAGQKDRRTSTGKVEQYDLEGVHVLKLPIVRLIPKKRYISLLIRARAKEEMKKAIKEWGQFDVIVSHFCSNHLFLVEEAKKLLNCPVVSVFHSCDITDQITAKKIIDGSDMIGARSAQIESCLKEQTGYKGKIVRVISGVPKEYIKGKRERLTQGKYRFIYVGKLIKRKHVSEILDAFSRIDQTYDYQLEIVGDGLEKAKLEAKANCLGLEGKVVFTGTLNRDEVAARMAASDCFIMISEDETFGLVYLEAMASGCLVVGSRGEGIDGIIVDGENGFLVKPGDAGELYEKILEIMNMGPVERKELIDRGYETVVNLTDEKVARSYIEEIEAIL